MTNDPDHYKTVDTRIHITDAYDVQLWSLVLGVSESQVMSAARQVGPDAIAVQAELKRLKDEADQSSVPQPTR